jgi:BirA family biotin operon repressor/biotin-[acetyl-CoA-carboxylase] ligase
MSLSWPFAISYQQLHLLPLSIALAITETLEKLNLKQVQIKWPNDVYVQGKKIAGILIETQPVNKKQIAVVIGVGLNYDMSPHTPLSGHDRTQTLADLTDINREIETQAIEQKTNRIIVASTLLHYVVDVCQNFQQDAKYYLEKFRTQYDYCKEKNVEIILDNKEVISGIAQGVNDNAELIVLVDGRECVFNSADVSVKTGM